VNLITPPPAPPLKGEGSSDDVSPPSLSGKGAGGLGRMHKVSYNKKS